MALTADPETATYLHSDLAEILEPSDLEAELFPPTGHHPYDRDQIAQAEPVMQRADVLQALREGFDGLLVTSVDALFERVPPPDAIDQESVTVKIGEQHDPDELVSWLVERDFERVEFVEHPGEVALRGGILDVFPFTGAFPIRIDFFGDEVDGIREFDPESQRSVSSRSSARIVPDLEEITATTERTSTPFAYLPDETPLAVFDEDRLGDRIEELFEEAGQAYLDLREELEEDDEVPAAPRKRFVDREAFEQLIGGRPQLAFGVFSQEEGSTVEFASQAQPSFNSSVSLLRERIDENATSGMETHILCDSSGQKARL